MSTKIKLIQTIKSPDNDPIEIVERKGLGHPDTLADGIAESISIEFSKFTLKKYGAILNHWVDKVLITGAQGEIDFGKGVLRSKIQIYIFGKMSKSFAGENIDIKPICKKAIINFLSEALPTLNLERDVQINFTQNDYSKNPYWMNPRNLGDLPNRTDPRSNDSSVSIAYWPLSKMERLVLEIEKYFYDFKLRPRFRYIGQDIKILLVRNDWKVDITLCVPFIANDCPSEAFYLRKMSEIKFGLINKTESFLGSKYKTHIDINNADKMPKLKRTKRKGYYMLVSGSSLDDGEVGVVGRGNPATGVISSYRIHSVEAPYGKNPVYHAGKVYHYLSQKIARKVSNLYNANTTVIIASKMGDKIINPANIIIEINKKFDKQKVKELVLDVLRGSDWAREIITSRYFIPKPGGADNYGGT